MTLQALLGTDVVLFFIIGLLGGAHCIGMCGPLVTVYANRMDDGRSRGVEPDGGYLSVYEVRQHGLFNLGRAASYTAIGALMGAIGSAAFVSVGRVSDAAGTVRGVVGIVIGVAIVVIGIRHAFGRTHSGISLPGLSRLTTWLTHRVDRLANGPGIVGLGAVHGLLPCPIIYPAYLYAFASGSPTAGAIALAALGIGTIPAVFGYGTVIESIDAAHRQWLYRALGVVFVILGYVLFAHGLMSLGIHVPHPSLPFWNPIDPVGPAGAGHAGH